MKPGRLNEPPCSFASLQKPTHIPNYLQNAPTPRSSRNGTQDRDQDTRTNEGNDNRPDQATCTYAKQACKAATNDRSNDAYDDISNDTIATAADNQACQEATDQTDDKPLCDG